MPTLAIIRPITNATSDESERLRATEFTVSRLNRLEKRQTIRFHVNVKRFERFALAFFNNLKFYVVSSNLKFCMQQK